jgi:cell division protein FtsB
MVTTFAPLPETTCFPRPLVPERQPQNPETQKRYSVLLRDIAKQRQSSQRWLFLFEASYEKEIQLIAVQLIKDIIRSSDIEESEEAENELYRQLTGRETVLQNIAMDSNELINVRAMAARLFVAKLGRAETELLNHRSSLIRLGVVLGFADARKWDLVKKFINDPHPVVAEEAKELLEDVEG